MINLAYLQMFIILLLIPTLTLTLAYCLFDWEIERTVTKHRILCKIFTLATFIAVSKIYIESLLKFII